MALHGCRTAAKSSLKTGENSSCETVQKLASTRLQQQLAWHQQFLDDVLSQCQGAAQQMMVLLLLQAVKERHLRQGAHWQTQAERQACLWRVGQVRRRQMLTQRWGLLRTRPPALSACHVSCASSDTSHSCRRSGKTHRLRMLRTCDHTSVMQSSNHEQLRT